MENKQYWKRPLTESIQCSRMFDGGVLGLHRCKKMSIGSYLEQVLVGGYFHSVLIFFCEEHEPNEY